MAYGTTLNLGQLDPKTGRFINPQESQDRYLSNAGAVNSYQQASGNGFQGLPSVPGLDLSGDLSSARDRLLSGFSSSTPATSGSPAVQGPSPAPAGGDFKAALVNLVNTGTANPKTPAATPTTTQPMATLVNPKTGDRRAVVVGSQEAQRLFAPDQGYVLETTAPGGGATGTSPVTPTPDSTPEQSRLSFLGAGSRQDNLRNDVLRAKTEMYNILNSPISDNLQDLDPRVARANRDKQVQGIAAEIRKIESTITSEKQDAMELFNIYSKAGALDQLDPNVAASIGISDAALKKMQKVAAQKDVELREWQGNLYSVTQGENGEPIFKLEMKKPESGSGSVGTQSLGGQEYPKEFVTYYNSYVKPSLTLPSDISGPNQQDTPSSIRSAYEKWKTNIVTDKAVGGSDSADRTNAIFTIEKYKESKTPAEIFNAILNGTNMAQDDIKKLMENNGLLLE